MGLGCVESKGGRLVCVGHRVIRAKPAGDHVWTSRLKTIYQAIEDAIRDWQPEAVAVEKVFFAKNADSALKLGQARGAALAAASMLDIPIFEYPATSVKQAVTSSGRADKDQVYQMIRLLLGASLRAAGELERHDASDALAIAICHTQQNIRLASRRPEGRTI